MPQIIRHYRPYTPPIIIDVEPAFIKPQSCGSIGHKKTGRPKGYYQPAPGVFERVLSVQLAANPKVTRADVMGQGRLGPITKVRRAIACELYKNHNWSGAQIARALDRDSSTVYSMIGARKDSKHFGILDNMQTAA